MIKHMKTEMTAVSAKLSKEIEEAHDTGLWLLASSGGLMHEDRLLSPKLYSSLRLLWSEILLKRTPIGRHLQCVEGDLPWSIQSQRLGRSGRC